jgi:hypothetical protein
MCGPPAGGLLPAATCSGGTQPVTPDGLRPARRATRRDDTGTAHAIAARVKPLPPRDRTRVAFVLCRCHDPVIQVR